MKDGGARQVVLFHFPTVFVMQQKEEFRCRVFHLTPTIGFGLSWCPVVLPNNNPRGNSEGESWKVWAGSRSGGSSFTPENPAWCSVIPTELMCFIFGVGFCFFGFLFSSCFPCAWVGAGIHGGGTEMLGQKWDAEGLENHVL